MKKIVFVLAVLLLAVPAMSEVLIECTSDGNEVTVTYDATTESPNDVRAFALHIMADSNAIIDNVDPCFVGEGAGYGIFPGTIDINDTTGEVDSDGTPVAPASAPDNPGQPGSSSDVIIEMGSLYVGAGNAPPSTGGLFKFTVDNDCNISISANTLRGGVVMEDNTTRDPNCPGCIVTVSACGDCQMDTSGWEGYGTPDGYVGPEDVGNIIQIISPCPSYYCAVSGPSDPNYCLDTSGWEGYGIPDGYVGPEDLGYVISTITPCPSYYCVCPAP